MAYIGKIIPGPFKDVLRAYELMKTNHSGVYVRFTEVQIGNHSLKFFFFWAIHPKRRLRRFAPPISRTMSSLMVWASRKIEAPIKLGGKVVFWNRFIIRIHFFWNVFKLKVPKLSDGFHQIGLYLVGCFPA